MTCNIYTGKDERGGRGLSQHVVKQSVEPYLFQGYFVFCDNYFSSQDLFKELLSVSVRATGTFRVTWLNIPEQIVALKEAMTPKSAPRGTGYYLYQEGRVTISERTNSCMYAGRTVELFTLCRRSIQAMLPSQEDC